MKKGVLEMPDQSDRCEIKVGPQRFKCVEFEMSGDCTETLKIIEDLPPRKRRYLKRRVKIVG